MEGSIRFRAKGSGLQGSGLRVQGSGLGLGFSAEGKGALEAR